MIGQTNGVPSIPSETARAARAVFSRKNFYILVGEQLEFLLTDIRLESLSVGPKASRTGGAILPLTTFFQFTESLTDEQTTDAVRTRIDWKYALHLPVNTLTFHQNALCKFRQEIVRSPASQHEFQKLVDRLITLNPPYHQELRDLETLVLLSSICSLNITYWVLEAMHAALGALASRFPEWLLQIAQPHWYWRFNHLSPFANPVSSMRQQDVSMEELGADIKHLLEEVYQSNSAEINELKEIKTLHHILERQFDKGRTIPSAQSGSSIQLNCNACIYMQDERRTYF